MKQFREHKNIALPQVFRPSENAFTLVELMIAIVVLSIGLLAAASMQITAVQMNSSANALTETVNIAQCRLEEVMALEYSTDFCDPGLIDDVLAGNTELFTDLNGNAVWDFGENFIDSNHNGVWDAAHVDQNPPQGYTIAYSVTDSRPVEHSKLIRMYVTRNDRKKTILLSCIKPRE